MKRKLTIFLADDSYQIKSDDEKIVSVKCSDLTIGAKDLYEQFFADAIIGERADVEVDIDKSATLGAAERKICEKIKELIQSICDKINEKALETTRADQGALSEAEEKTVLQDDADHSKREFFDPPSQGSGVTDE